MKYFDGLDVSLKEFPSVSSMLMVRQSSEVSHRPTQKALRVGCTTDPYPVPGRPRKRAVVDLAAARLGEGWSSGHLHRCAQSLSYPEPGS